MSQLPNSLGLTQPNLKKNNPSSEQLVSEKPEAEQTAEKTISEKDPEIVKSNDSQVKDVVSELKETFEVSQAVHSQNDRENVLSPASEKPLKKPQESLRSEPIQLEEIKETVVVNLRQRAEAQKPLTAVTFEKPRLQSSKAEINKLVKPGGHAAESRKPLPKPAPIEKNKSVVRKREEAHPNPVVVNKKEPSVLSKKETRHEEAKPKAEVSSAQDARKVTEPDIEAPIENLVALEQEHVMQPVVTEMLVDFADKQEGGISEEMTLVSEPSVLADKLPILTYNLPEEPQKPTTVEEYEPAEALTQFDNLNVIYAENVVNTFLELESLNTDPDVENAPVLVVEGAHSVDIQAKVLLERIFPVGNVEAESDQQSALEFKQIKTLAAQEDTEETLVVLADFMRASEVTEMDKEFETVSDCLQEIQELLPENLENEVNIADALITPKLVGKLIDLFTAIGFEQPEKVVLDLAKTYGTQGLLEVVQGLAVLNVYCRHEYFKKAQATATNPAVADISGWPLGKLLLWFSSATPFPQAA